MTKKNIIVILVIFVLSIFSLFQFSSSTLQAKAQGNTPRNANSRVESKADKFTKLDRVPGNFIVKFKQGASADRQISAKSATISKNKEIASDTFVFTTNGQNQNVQSVSEIEKLIITPEAILKVVQDSNNIIDDIKNNPNIEFIEPDYIVKADFIPNDTFYSSEWFLKNTGQNGGIAGTDIKAQTAWDINKGSASVVIAVIDSGVLLSHPDLTNKIFRDSNNNIIGFDFANNDSDPTDDNGHGTHVAGTIAADSNNNLGVSGVCQNCKIMPIKFLNSSGSGSVSSGINSINFAVANGAKIINNSWGSPSYSSALQTAIDNAYNAGVTVVGSAGNNNNSNLNYPAALNHVISVASTTPNDSKSSFSNYGSTVDISAPGSSILSTIIPNANFSSTCGDNTFLPDGDGYGYCDGTSMSAPVVSGVAGLVASQFPSYTPAQIENQLKNTTDNIDAVNPAYIASLGTGRVNAFKALSTTPTPNLKLVSSNSSDSVGGNGNSIIEPGESINLSVTIGNDWGNATNVNGILSSTNPNVTILQPNGNFGNISASSPTAASFIFKTNTNSTTPQTLTFNLALKDGNSYTKNIAVTQDLVKPISLPQNWTFATDGQNWSPESSSLWHLSDTCAPASPDRPAKYWHYGKPLCGSYDTGVANSGKLYSPVIAGLAGSNNVVLSFDQFLETENSSNYDQAYLKVKIYGNSDATALVLDGPLTNSIGWEKKQYSIPKAIANSSAYQIFFDFNSVDSVSNNFKGWFVDNIKLNSTSANPSDVLVSEINWAGSPAANNDYFIELYNATNSPIDLNSFTVKNIGMAVALDFKIGSGTCSNTIIPAKDYFLIANHSRQDAETMLNVTADCLTALDLSGSGKQITLVSQNNIQIDQTPTGNWAAGLKTSCLTTNATLPCYSMSRDVSNLVGSNSSSWFTTNQSLNMDSNYTYLNDTPAVRTTWVANLVGSGEKMTPKASNGFANPASQASYTFCASKMHFNRTLRQTELSDPNALCSEVVSETNTGTQGYHLSYGPYLSNLQLNQIYTATFRIRANLATNSILKAASLDVVDGSYKVIGSTSVLENELTSGSYINKTITFTTQSTGNIEARVYINNDNLNFFVDQITIAKGGIAPTSWTYESENQPSSTTDAVVISDISASGQRAKSGKIDGYLLYGPYTKEQTGGSWYRASYTIKRGAYSPSSPELNYILLDAYNSGGFNQIGRKEVKYSELSETYQNFSFDFYKPDNTGTMEYRAKLNNSNNNAITIDKISVAQIPTPTEFSRNIEAELSYKRIGTEIKDGTFDVRSSNVLGFMSYGPYSNDLPTNSVPGYGNYSVTFYIKNAGNKVGNIAKIDVFNGNGTNSTTLAVKNVTSAELNSSNYTPVTINFSRTALAGSLEYRIQNLNDGNEIRVDKIVVNKI